MRNKERLFKLLDNIRIKLFYGFAIFAIFLFIISKSFNLSAYNFSLAGKIALSFLFILTGLIYLCEGAYIRKLLIVGKFGAYDHYYKKQAVTQGIILFLLLFNLTMMLWFYNKLFIILTGLALLLSILSHIILGSGR